MKRKLLLAKIIVISDELELPKKYDEYYDPELGLYCFYSCTEYDTVTGHFSDVLLMHDKIAAKAGITSIINEYPEYVNYISIDNKASDRHHTYFSSNRRGYQLTGMQEDYLAGMFDADYWT